VLTRDPFRGIFFVTLINDIFISFDVCVLVSRYWEVGCHSSHHRDTASDKCGQQNNKIEKFLNGVICISFDQSIDTKSLLFLEEEVVSTMFFTVIHIFSSNIPFFCQGSWKCGYRDFRNTLGSWDRSWFTTTTNVGRNCLVNARTAHNTKDCFPEISTVFPSHYSSLPNKENWGDDWSGGWGPWKWICRIFINLPFLKTYIWNEYKWISFTWLVVYWTLLVLLLFWPADAS